MLSLNEPRPLGNSNGAACVLLIQLCLLLPSDRLAGSCLQMSNEGISLLIEVLKTLTALFDKQGKHVQPATAVVLQRCWALFISILPLYENTKIHSSSNNDNDSEDGYVRLPSESAESVKSVN